MLGRVFFDRNLQLLHATKYTPDLCLKRAWLAFLTEEQMEEDRARFYSPVVYLCSCWHTHTHTEPKQREIDRVAVCEIFVCNSSFVITLNAFLIYMRIFFCCFCCSSALPVHFVSRVDLTEWWLLWVCSVHKRFCFLDFFSLLKSIFFCANYLWCSQ